MANGEQNGWNEYSKLVIAELERLNDGITNLNGEWRWKKEVDEVASPSQLDSTIKEVAALKTFKTQAITVWAALKWFK